MTNPISISCVFGPILDTCHARQGVCYEKQTNIFVILQDFLGFLSSALFLLLSSLFDQNHTNRIFFHYTFSLLRPLLCYGFPFLPWYDPTNSLTFSHLSHCT